MQTLYRALVNALASTPFGDLLHTATYAACRVVPRSRDGPLS